MTIGAIIRTGTTTRADVAASVRLAMTFCAFLIWSGLGATVLSMEGSGRALVLAPPADDVPDAVPHRLS